MNTGVSWNFRNVNKAMNVKEKSKKQLIAESDKQRKRAADLESTENVRDKGEAAMRTVQLEIDAIFQNAPLIMFLVDRDRRMCKLNKAAIAMCRRTEEESIGLRGGEALRCINAFDDPRGCGFSSACKSCVVRNTVLDTFKTCLNHQAVAAPIPYDAEHGTVALWVLVSTTFLKLPRGERVLVCMQDITERKKIEEALQKAHDELERQVEERTFELTKANEQLKLKAGNHEETNIALKVLLKKRDEDKIELEEKVLLNMKELVVPYLEKLKKSGLDDRQKTFADILESNLNDIISPFMHTLSSKYSNLTPKEIRVAGLVKEGKTTKEIAELLISSTDSIDFYRKNIRKKLGLQNTKSNLRSYLLSLS